MLVSIPLKFQSDFAFENDRPVIAVVDDMINRPTELDPRFTRHNRIETP